MALHDVPFVDPTTANLLIEAPGEDRIVPVEIAGVIKQLRESELLVLRGSMEDDNEIARWVQHRVKTLVGISTTVRVFDPDSIERTQTGKARRVVDTRPR